MKIRRWRWRDEVYGIDVALVRSADTLDVFMRKIERDYETGRYSEEELDRMRHGYATAFIMQRKPHEKSTLYLWFSKRVNVRTAFGLSTIGHEAVHAAVAMFRHKGLTLSSESEEALAYYQTYIFEQVYKRLRG